ncbi:CoA-binding protein [Emticicia sp. TH156]|uniref:CoA-binding protein n=1 Tax=Emticicia sp. TH156 TaxID=2067454 RepID=UPI000C75A047|nr:CoA-binding protein [Emticicia sp. TH156]PLK44161.1 CoA-binding protein [Emticicia sp. TH156]
MSKKTLIIGASTDPARYAFLAANRLLNHGHEIELIGRDTGNIGNKEIQTSKPNLDGIDTVTMYVSPKHQPEYYDYIVSLKPKRVIFNPGTENTEFEDLLAKNNIEPLEACTLVMLSTGQY